VYLPLYEPKTWRELAVEPLCNVSIDLAQEAGLGRGFHLKEVRNRFEVGHSPHHGASRREQQTTKSKPVHEDFSQWPNTRLYSDCAKADNSSKVLMNTVAQIMLPERGE
jgi:hypothetical protein